MINKLVFASRNNGKIKEIKQMLEPYGVEVLTAVDLNLEDVEETGTTFAENAALKAVAAAKATGLPSLADDSGLCVDALGGRPGVYSARYAPNRDFNKGMDMLLDELKGVPAEKRSAHFMCILALAEPNCECRFFEGRVNGYIAEKRSGTTGFGFDPLFVPEGHKTTFAEMSAEEKASMSHRGNAFKAFISEVFEK